MFQVSGGRMVIEYFVLGVSRASAVLWQHCPSSALAMQGCSQLAGGASGPQVPLCAHSRVTEGQQSS